MLFYAVHKGYWGNRLHTHSIYKLVEKYAEIDWDNFSAKFWLEAVALAKNIGFRGKELRKLESLVRENQTKLVEAWNGYFTEDTIGVYLMNGN